MRMRKTTKRVAATYRHNGILPGMRDTITTVWHGLYKMGPWYNESDLFDENWDLAIVLDACRPDSIRKRSKDYEFLKRASHIDQTMSVGSWSGQWMERTFLESDRDFSDTAYVTANPFSEEYLRDSVTFGHLDEVWINYWDDDYGTVLAEKVTDRAIWLGRNHSFDRTIVHYMQPHFPSVPDPLGTKVDIPTIDDGGFSTQGDQTAWELEEEGDLSLGRLRESYEANLDYVLDSLSTLLNNFESDRVLITADHGQAFGEMGLTAHPLVPYPPVRSVPWVITTSDDNRVHEGEKPDGTADKSITVEDRLQDLGYLS